MKVTPKQYAILLYELTKQAKNNNVDAITQQFLNLLIKNRNLALLSKITLLYKDYYNQQEETVDVEIVTAKETHKNLAKAVEEQLQKQKCNIETRIDKSVLGGAAVRVGDYLIDDTLKARLLKLKKSLND